MNTNENLNDNKDRLQELGGSDYKIAEGEENIKGWDVKDGQDNDLGDVDDLIFDTQSLKVRYIILDVDKNKDLGLEDRKVLIPIGMAQLDKEDDNVILRNITVDQIRSLPEYDKDNLNTDYETRNYSSLVGATAVAGTGADFYNNDYFNDENLYKNRSRIRTENERYKNDISDIDRSDRKDYTSNTRDNDNTTDETIPVIEERLNVGKKEVERGGVRITSRVVENPVEKNVNLREEHVTVERNPVDRAATDSDLENAKDQDIEVRERAEVPVVNKEARVVEEIKLKKEVSEHEETINETVRKTEVNVDELSKNKRDYTDDNS